MKCSELVEWLDEVERDVSRPLPAAAEEHCRSCQSCRRLLAEERVWRNLFALAAEPAEPRKPVWPGVMERIEERERHRASLSDALFIFSRRLFPAFLFILVLLGGVTLWLTDRESENKSGATMIAMLTSSAGGNATPEEPDAVLNSWLGANGQ